MSEKETESISKESIGEESTNEENIRVSEESTIEESSAEEKNTDEESIGTSEEDSFEESSTEEEASCDEEDPAENSIDDIKVAMYEHLVTQFPAVDFIFGYVLEESNRSIMGIVADNTIAFRQILSQDFTLSENQIRVQGSYERNLMAYDKLSKEYMEKHGQEIMYMDQAEVTSIKTVKKIEKS